MKIGVVTDSNSGILPEEANKLGVWLLPMPFYIDGNCYYENVDLTRQDFFAKLAAGAEIATSSPAPLAVAELWSQALAECDQILHIPMSSGFGSRCLWRGRKPLLAKCLWRILVEWPRQCTVPFWTRWSF